ncbi:MAG: IS1182 family transposase [Deltaproteobacteria bacterium]|nr:IS1182 family transposase [Deltaproteobacteria bacterium]MBK6919200.1 IS1182 family transposase [Deltaproteobacteria bacterium]MBK6919865.1 IS1182 family transposase [Deltaproteobacteria bacterium]MBK6921542.1 IS1182 family transposase [Deltaproteobacteria bacterium]MBK8715020.1 IS1182 family transposase [Deltaproteobacteria bacterium]
MLWKVPTKLSAEEQRLVARMRKPSRFFVFLREIRAELFTPEFQEELARAYEPRGQEPVPPALLAMVVLLQAYTQTSDAAAVEEAEMNPRWQLVLGLLGEEKAPFGQGSLPRFRERMAAHDLDRRLLERTVELAKRTGGFGWQKLKAAFDSSPLRGRGRVADTWNLIGQAMGKLVSALAKIAAVEEDTIIAEARLTLLQGSSIKAALDIDWDDHDQRSEALQRLVGEAQALLDWARARAPDAMKEREVEQAAVLLERVLHQDTEPDPERPRRVRIRKGVAEDRVCSVGDPEMRHGRKTRSQAFNGYKRYIATSIDAPLVLAAEARPANQPEREAVPSLVDQVAPYGELDELFIDRGFLAHPEIAALDRDGVQVRCRPWREQNKHGRFGKSAFKIDLRRRLVTCPSGKQAEYSANTPTAYFGAETCDRCRLRARCTDAKAGRAIRIHPHESLHRKLEARRATEHGRQHLRARVVVEHRLARIGGLQSDRARYKGARKNTLDLRRHAAVANLIELQAALAA